MSVQVNWSEVNVDVGWGVLRGKRCIVGGTSASPTQRLFCLHGWLDNANSFDLLVPMLPAGVEVFALDFPGHGLSDHLPDGAHYEPITYVVNVRAVVLKLGWDSFVLLAHSYGSLVASCYISLYPANVSAFISLDYLRPYDSRDRVITWRLETDLILRSEQSKKTFAVYSEKEALYRIVKSRMIGPKHDVVNIDRDSAAVLLPRSARRVEGGLTWCHDRKVRASFEEILGDENFFHVLAKIKCPVLMVFGSKGIVVPYLDYEVIMNIICSKSSNFLYAVVEGSHHVHLTCPSRVLPSVSKFLFDVKCTQNSLSKL